MTTIISLAGLGKGCSVRNCATEKTYHGELRQGPAVHEVDGKPLCEPHSPVGKVDGAWVNGEAVGIFRIEWDDVNSGVRKAVGQTVSLEGAKRYARPPVREILSRELAMPSRVTVGFDYKEATEAEPGIVPAWYCFYNDKNGNPVPFPMRIVQSELTIGDWVHVKLHGLAQTPDCHEDLAANQCTHPHQQVGRIARLYKRDGSGWVADVDFQPLTHRLAGAATYPSGITTLSVTILTKITPTLRGWEILEGVRHTRFEQHCRTCDKPVIQIYYRWSNERSLVTIGQVNEDHHLDGWRHADGSPFHGEFSWGCEPKPRCEHCGFEGGSHCHKCHQGSSITVEQLPYGNQSTCQTPGCAYESYHSIGD